MRIFPFTSDLGARHSGNRGWLGNNPKIEIVRPGEPFDFVWFNAWGDGDDLLEDMEKARRIGRCIFVVTGDACYVPEKADGNFYFVTNLNPMSTCYQAQVPYSYHDSVTWYEKHGLQAFEKKNLACFQGSFLTNPKRSKLWELSGEQIIIRDCDGWQAAQAGHWYVIEEHNELLASSWFTLCPKGIGKSSIRVVEAIFRDSLPVMLDDNSCFFGDPMKFAIRYPLGGDMGELRGILEAMEGTPEYYNRRDEMRAFRNHFLLGDERAECKGTIGYSEWIRGICS